MVQKKEKNLDLKQIFSLKEIKQLNPLIISSDTNPEFVSLKKPQE